MKQAISNQLERAENPNDLVRTYRQKFAALVREPLKATDEQEAYIISRAIYLKGMIEYAELQVSNHERNADGNGNQALRRMETGIEREYSKDT